MTLGPGQAKPSPQTSICPSQLQTKRAAGRGARLHGKMGFGFSSSCLSVPTILKRLALFVQGKSCQEGTSCIIATRGWASLLVWCWGL